MKLANLPLPLTRCAFHRSTRDGRRRRIHAQSLARTCDRSLRMLSAQWCSSWVLASNRLSYRRIRAQWCWRCCFHCICHGWVRKTCDSYWDTGFPAVVYRCDFSLSRNKIWCRFPPATVVTCLNSQMGRSPQSSPVRHSKRSSRRACADDDDASSHIRASTVERRSRFSCLAFHLAALVCAMAIVPPHLKSNHKIQWNFTQKIFSPKNGIFQIRMNWMGNLGFFNNKKPVTFPVISSTKSEPFNQIIGWKLSVLWVIRDSHWMPFNWILLKFGSQAEKKERVWVQSDIWIKAAKSVLSFTV